jgi:hypothetical protein
MPMLNQWYNLIKFCAVDSNDMFSQVVKLKYCVSCIRLNDQQILGSQVKIIKIYVIIIAGNIKIHRCICFCKIITSAKQIKLPLQSKASTY